MTKDLHFHFFTSQRGHLSKNDHQKKIINVKNNVLPLSIVLNMCQDLHILMFVFPPLCTEFGFQNCWFKKKNIYISRLSLERV